MEEHTYYRNNKISQIFEKLIDKNILDEIRPTKRGTIRVGYLDGLIYIMKKIGIRDAYKEYWKALGLTDSNDSAYKSIKQNIGAVIPNNFKKAGISEFIVGFSESIKTDRDLIQAISKAMKEQGKYTFYSEILKILYRVVENDMKSEINAILNQDKSVEVSIKKLILEGGVLQIILTGAPGTGKTYVAKTIAEEIMRELQGNELIYEFVQFHPSYDYTDFVEGIRPIETNGGNINTVSFAKIDGIFKSYCRKIVEEGAEDKKYFFIIDEINRANLSKVFGELMFGLEKDKRGEENRFKTQYQNLKTYDLKGKKYLEKEEDVFFDGFYIPKNLIIIGTMNDIDRSVESMDFALRRRFEWKEFKVDKNMLKSAFETGEFGTVIKEYAYPLAMSITNLNDVIKKDGAVYGLNEHYFISQGQFANLPNDIANGEDKNDETKLNELKKFVWEYRIKSLLEEYVRGESEVDKFISNCKEKFIETPGEISEVGNNKDMDSDKKDVKEEKSNQVS